MRLERRVPVKIVQTLSITKDSSDQDKTEILLSQRLINIS